MDITIHGEVRSKKNSRIIARVGARFRSFPSTAYQRFCNEAKQEIMIQKATPIDPPYEVWYRFYLKGNKRIDLDNAVASINDILQEMRVITDDNEILHLHARKIAKCTENQTVVTILRARYEENESIGK